MAKLYFKFGAMGSSKSAQALMTKFNYEEKNKNVFLMKPSTDNRDDKVDENGNTVAEVKSRIGLSSPAVTIGQNDDIIEMYLERNRSEPVDVIICDECQFLTEKQIEQMKDLADIYDVPVLCFGLRADFRTKLFPGSKRLFEIADSITEIKSVCRCGRKATVNARLDGKGNILTEGSQVMIGGNESYVGMCYKCYREQIEKQKAGKPDNSGRG